MKTHKKLFSGTPINFTFFVISPKLQIIWSWNVGFATRKMWTFIWYQKMYYFRLSIGDENVIGIRSFYGHGSILNVAFLKTSLVYLYSMGPIAYIVNNFKDAFQKTLTSTLEKVGILLCSDISDVYNIAFFFYIFQEKTGPGHVSIFSF